MKYASPALAFVFGYLLMLAFWTATARGHDWYPKECCSGKDCAMIDASQVQVTPNGYIFRGINIAFRSARQSPDEQYHACIYNKIVGCFFAPKLGF